MPENFGAEICPDARLLDVGILPAPAEEDVGASSVGEKM
jgi:hypothetical protein